jgi:predicted nucleotidyltransferase component of viral defense system
MRKDFVNEVAEKLEIKRKDLVEKDFILHQILLGLSENEFFRENFMFKGGTCLIKCYLGYFRFSEDMDFTWKKQEAFKGMPRKEIRRRLSKTINTVGKLLENAAKENGLDFRCDKKDKHYVEFGGGNKTVTFKMWYVSEFLGRESFVKIQINFLEELHFPGVRNAAASLLLVKDGKDAKTAEIRLLFPEEYGQYSKKIMLETYDIREILCEKIRAMLTRKGTKARDFVDVYLICREFDIRPESLEKQAEDKIAFMLKMYSKYKNNIGEKRRLLESGEIFSWGDERSLLLAEINEKDFYAFLGGFTALLEKIAANCMKTRA